MQPELPTLILRHRRENLKKCTLTGLEKRADCLFLTYPQDPLPDLTSYCLLKVGAPPLTLADNTKGVFLIDATWRLAQIMEKNLKVAIAVRSLPPHYRTAYPRRQTDCPNPQEGLSSLEALYLAYLILGRSVEGLLDHYHWKDAFLCRNALTS